MVLSLFTLKTGHKFKSQVKKTIQQHHAMMQSNQIKGGVITLPFISKFSSPFLNRQLPVWQYDVLKGYEFIELNTHWLKDSVSLNVMQGLVTWKSYKLNSLSHENSICYCLYYRTTSRVLNFTRIVARHPISKLSISYLWFWQT